MLEAVSDRAEPDGREAGGTWRLPAATTLVVGVSGVLLVAVLSATGESAVEIGQGWVPSLGDNRWTQPDDSGPLREDDFEAPPVLRAIAAFTLIGLLLLFALLFVVGLVTILLSVRIGRLRERQKVAPIDAGEAPDDNGRIDVDLIRRAAGGALDLLREQRGGDPGDAVVQAWLTLERAAADCGLARRAHQTPTEFTTAVLADLQVDGGALDRLRLLYQRARFSVHPVTDAEVSVARDALHRLVADLGARTAAGAG